MNDLLAASRALLPGIVETRRLLHRHPERGNHLPLTRRIVLDALDGLPLEVNLHETTSGIAAVLRGKRPGPTIVLRGDMDALPVQEDTGLPFASEHPGLMHACGHDLHTAMLVGAARILSSVREEFAGAVVFMFQPGEEGFFGARLMLEEGLLDTVDPRPTGAFAMHVTTWFTSGTLQHRPGPQMASSDEVHITVRGKGGHASAPYLSYDPIPVASEIVLAVETALTRRINVFQPGVITFAMIDAGTTHNVIPETARMLGTVRALSDDTRAELHTILRRVARNVAKAHGMEADVRIELGYPVVVNDPAYTAFIDTVAGRTLGEGSVRPLENPSMGGEDWAYVLKEIPGTMSYLGACLPGQTPGKVPGNHSNRVVFDEEAMVHGMAMHAAVAMAHGRGEFTAPL
ncbi:MAG: M20 family metallopeptidase [bacterium]|nr:M20 family metallopeptidase [bacterium]MDE0290734.1 M20 family metallopeptidase [bacterium]MDE0440038.1 M20 family metallopeptidase [bacterium]